MTRSRSRSPSRRERRRSTSRDRERRRRERQRSRSRSPKRRHRSRSRSPRRRRSISPRRRSRSESPEEVPGSSEAPAVKKFDRKVLDEETVQKLSEEDQEMYKIMGFVNFDTTKGKKTAESTNAADAQILEKRKYRQYMNRRGGFNRPLDFIA